jgi:hypothetical protein
MNIKTYRVPTFYVTKKDLIAFQSGFLSQPLFYSNITDMVETEGFDVEYYEFNDAQFNQLIEDSQRFKLN